MTDISKMKVEIDDMDSYFSDPFEEREEETVDEVQESDADAEVEETNEVGEDTETDQEEVSESSEEAETKTDQEEDELTRYKKEVEELRAQIGELAAKKEPEKEPEPEPKAEKEPESSTTQTEQNFLDQFDFDEVTSDPKEFNKLLNYVYNKATADTREKLSENVLRSIPEIVRTNIATINNLKAASEKFYQENEDLQPFKKVVAAVFEEVASENPDKEFNDLLGQVAEESRKRLALHKKATAPSNKSKDNNPPNLPRKRGRQPRNQQPNVSGLESELAEMDRVLNS
jgi:hypothetical protein